MVFLVICTLSSDKSLSAKQCPQKFSLSSNILPIENVHTREAEIEKNVASSLSNVRLSIFRISWHRLKNASRSTQVFHSAYQPCAYSPIYIHIALAFFANRTTELHLSLLNEVRLVFLQR